MIMKGTNRKLIFIQVTPMKRFRGFSSVHEVQLLKESKFAVFKNIGKKTVLGPSAACISVNRKKLID